MRLKHSCNDEGPRWSYRTFDLILNSNFPIPSLVPIKDPSVSADLRVHLDVWPAGTELLAPSDPPSYASPFVDPSGESVVRIWQMSRRPMYRLDYCNGLKFIIDLDLGEIWATWADELSLQDAAAYLLGPVLGIFLRLRGETCLHASAVAFDDEAVVFVGPPGAGKSTTAAALNGRGCAVLSDDVVLLREEKPGSFRVVPSHPLLSLWPESVEMIGRSADDLPRIFSDFEKRRLALTDSSNPFETRSLPLGSIYLLDCRTNDPAPQMRSVSGQEALMALVVDTYGTYVLDGQRRAKEFALLGRLVSSIPIRSIQAPEGASGLSQLCDLVRNDYRSIRASRPVLIRAREALVV